MASPSAPLHTLPVNCAKCRMDLDITAFKLNFKGQIQLELYCPICEEASQASYIMYELIKWCLEKDRNSEPESKTIIALAFEKISDTAFLEDLRISWDIDPKQLEKGN